MVGERKWFSGELISYSVYDLIQILLYLYFYHYRWYHGELTRTAADTLLLQKDILECTYLLRKSTSHNGYSISVKCQGGVIKHFVLDYNNRIHEFKFGNASFDSLTELMRHFESCPILTKDNGKRSFSFINF